MKGSTARAHRRDATAAQAEALYFFDKKMKMGENVALPSGLFPVMLTPFCDDGGVDFAGLAKLTNWYIASGAVGLFGAFSSSAALPRPAPSSTHSLTNYCYCLPPFCSRSAEL